jgi:integrase/recombinase XerC
MALLYDRALRRGEVVSLDMENLDLEAGTLWVSGKGRSGQMELLTLAPETVKALEEWVTIRGEQLGPLFTNFDRTGKGERLTGSAIYYLIKYYGKQAGVDTRPHGLRHAAITEALDRTNGDYRAVQRFSRHKDPNILMRYDDNREDLGGEVSRLVASGFTR